MILKRGSVLAIFLLTLVFAGGAQAQPQAQGVPARVAALQAQVDQALATIAQLQAALIAEAALRQASDAALAGSMGGPSVNVITPAQLHTALGAQSSAWTAKLEEVLAAQSALWSANLEAAIAQESAARSGADGSLQEQIASETAARVALDVSVAPLFSLVPLSKVVSVSSNTINDLAGPHVIFSGVNVHIRNGIGDSYAPNGLGNFIVGYNESFGGGPAERGGSHNVVVGGQHRYNFGTGLVAGYANRLSGMGSAVSAGSGNEAVAFSNVSGGSNNRALGEFSTIAGGDSNITGGFNAVVTAGSSNAANGDMSSVTGGTANIAGALLSTVTGGSGTVNMDSFSVKP
jgi:hypothetical protein